MRIIIDGDLERVNPWWTKGTWICQHCGCQFELDRNDHGVINDNDPQGGSYAMTPCPFCGKQTDAYMAGGEANGFRPKGAS